MTTVLLLKLRFLGHHILHDQKYLLQHEGITFSNRREIWRLYSVTIELVELEVWNYQ